MAFDPQHAKPGEQRNCAKYPALNRAAPLDDAHDQFAWHSAREGCEMQRSN